tara:strand:- start:6707 stop:8095 length:1389 start_codon:yes stop_codon:yes gene_type:complete
MEVRTRFAPSPTGFLHVGGLRTALYNYIFAKQNNGKFILRIEDTDQKRLVKDAILKISESLNNFDITFDEGPNVNEQYGPYKQSDRLDIYKKYYIELVENNFAYLCYVDQNQNLVQEKNISKSLSLINTNHIKANQNFVIKFRIPKNNKFKTYDKLRGEIRFDLNLIDDPIIIKSDGFPTYHFANVIDDHLMKISHVIRGEEWLPSLPKHVLLYQSFGWTPPKFIHLPLLLNPDKSKLSKRQGDVDVDAFLNKGYLKESIINFIALLGWHPNNNDEIFNHKELLNNFSIKRIQKSGAIFDIKKLDWMNAQYIKKLTIEEFISIAIDFIGDDIVDISNQKKIVKVFTFIKDRINKLSDIIDLLYPFYHTINIVDQNILDCINNKISQDIIKYWCENLLLIKKIDKDSIEKLIKNTSEYFDVTGKQIFFPLRGILYGKFQGPDLYTIISILGIPESITRLERYI